MPPPSELPVDEEIFVPETLLAAATSSDAWSQRSPHDLPRQLRSGIPSDEVCVRKRRQTTPSWPSPAETDTPSRAEGRPLSNSHGRSDEIYPLYEDCVVVETSQGPHAVPHAELEGDGPTIDELPSQLPTPPPKARWTRRSLDSSTILNRFTVLAPFPLRQTLNPAVERARDSSRGTLYDKANLVQIKHQRRYWVRILIEYGAYTLLLLFVYLVLVGQPLWGGAIYWLYWVMRNKFVFQGGWAIVISLVIFYSFAPLLTLFEKDLPDPEYYQNRNINPAAPDTALLIPCYRSAPVIAKTLEAALKIFPASHVYVIANGDSTNPLDNTEEICRRYGVNHIWCPVGSKIIALFVGCYAAKVFRYVLLTDDDCVLPANFPVAISRLTDEVRCVGYTIKVTGSESSKGTYCQQAQDLEYKLAGLQRTFAGRIGSATFPHGAISLWERAFLKDTLQDHPGFSISEDWFLGNSCRRLGGRIKMCSMIFVETAAPPAFLWVDKEQSRGGFGEMTVFKQRFQRWNFFIVNGMRYNLAYVFGSWKLGRWEMGAKIFVLQEVYETVLSILAPFILPISMIVRPAFCIGLLVATLGLYLLNAVIFNEVHLRLKQERVSWKVIVGYYMPYKMLIAVINVISCYWSLIKYAKYFAQRRPKLIEDHKAVGIVLKLEEIQRHQQGGGGGLGRSMTVRTVGVRSRASKRVDSMLGTSVESGSDGVYVLRPRWINISSSGGYLGMWITEEDDFPLRGLAGAFNSPYPKVKG
ncbi:glycosyltransferase family 2 protein [Aspergillus saccharolyticus JOP 1030-1]|uniref:Glycosyl transferase n=1 Tax=Aspergillus saccharolyticus JOP 1030-1 TaxID=1450539 RepID=A0A318ZFV2_9EURO|nr:glycosyl transferase [Aspergillus saccharolyticus JOP 1030-1]PYH45587.1 glycosyl transferase [Aspergillus saccharolyticus JOP 1030-1]